jgi:peptidoglycan hydrolase-like protein with peptidoglycan-binding domain
LEARPARSAGIALAGAVLVALLPAPAQGAGDADVAALQVALRGAGYYRQTIDGVAGSGTRAAVSRFQARHGLAADGVAGAAQRRALGRRAGARFGSRTITRGDSGWDVAALQFRLAWRGFPSGTIDGGFGGHVQAALRRFQARAGLTADGVAGPARCGAARAIEIADLAGAPGAAVSDRFGPRGNRFHTGSHPGAGTLVTPRPRAWSRRLGLRRLRQPRRDRAPARCALLYAHLSRIGIRTGAA